MNKRELDESELPTAKVPRRTEKVAFLIAYIGTNYQGLQVNPDAYTIEGVFFDALRATEAISATDTPRDVQFMRCARTDKGVHAVGGVVALRCVVTEDLADRMNAALPYDVAVLDIVSVSNSFHAKNDCDQRTYTFHIPSVVFAPEELARQALGPRFLDEQAPDEVDRSAELDALYAFRVSDETLAAFDTYLQCFKGSHNFHNYTSTRSADDPSCQRFMRELSVSRPFVVNGIEIITITIVGQSFMLHQIRKMTGTAIMLWRYGLPPACVKRTLSKEKINLPLIPGNGLAIRRCWFQSRGRRQRSPELEWTRAHDAQERFIYERLLPHLAKLERGTYQAEWKVLRAEYIDRQRAIRDGDPDAIAAPPLVPRTVKPTRPHMFAMWLGVLARFPPERSVFTLHSLLRPQPAVAVIGSPPDTPTTGTVAEGIAAAVAACAADAAPRLLLRIGAPIVAVNDKRFAPGAIKVRGFVSVPSAPATVTMTLPSGESIVLATISEPGAYPIDMTLDEAETSLQLCDRNNIMGAPVAISTEASTETTYVGVRSDTPLFGVESE